MTYLYIFLFSSLSFELTISISQCDLANSILRPSVLFKRSLKKQESYLVRYISIKYNLFLYSLVVNISRRRTSWQLVQRTIPVKPCGLSDRNMAGQDVAAIRCIGCSPEGGRETETSQLIRYNTPPPITHTASCLISLSRRPEVRIYFITWVAAVAAGWRRGSGQIFNLPPPTGPRPPAAPSTPVNRH